jgi:predicted glutamine amidotransferase
MCRLMGYVADPPQSLRGLLGSSYASFEQFSCDLHDDGWGVAWVDGSRVKVQKEPVPAFTSERYRSLVDQPLNAALIHYRWATLSLDVELGNTHPFNTDSVAFAHNGSISPPSSLDDLISPPFQNDLEGTTDSERYFRAVLSESEDANYAEGLRVAITKIAESLQYSSLNALMLTPDALYAACFYSPSSISKEFPADYYDMHYRHKNGAVMVASSGWEHDGWTPLANGNMLSISRGTGETRVIPITTRVEAK